MTTVNPDDVWIFIFEKGQVRTRDITAHFVETQRMSRGTMYKYLRALESEGKIHVKPIRARPPYNLYYVPESQHQNVTTLKSLHVFNSTAGLFQTHEMAWQDCPPGLFLTDVKQKILWKNDVTGASFTLYKIPPGVAEKLHYHPDATVAGYWLSGEAESPDGTRIPLEGMTGYATRGRSHMWLKYSKETFALCFADGPLSKVYLDNSAEEQQLIEDYWEKVA